jgi:hypothetical protein
VNVAADVAVGVGLGTSATVVGAHEIRFAVTSRNRVNRKRRKRVMVIVLPRVILAQNHAARETGEPLSGD